MAEATREEETEEQFASEDEGGEEEFVVQLHAGDTDVAERGEAAGGAGDVAAPEQSAFQLRAQEVLSLCQEELAAEEPTDANDRRLAARLRTSLASLLRTAAAPPRPPGAKGGEGGEGGEPRRRKSHRGGRKVREREARAAEKRISEAAGATQGAIVGAPPDPTEGGPEGGAPDIAQPPQQGLEGGGPAAGPPGERRRSRRRGRGGRGRDGNHPGGDSGGPGGEGGGRGNRMRPPRDAEGGGRGGDEGGDHSGAERMVDSLVSS